MKEGGREMRVIINADDFGYSVQVNEAIEKAIEARRISSTTIMANAPFFEDAITIARKYDYISYGVHLNLIEFEPLTNQDVFERYKLLDSKGCFIEGAALCLSDYPSELKQAIKEEWSAQIRKVQDTGIKISHVDSHQHTHCVAAFQDILIEVMSEFGINKCRRKAYFSICRMLRSREYKVPTYNKETAVKPPKKTIFFKLFNHFILLPMNQHKWISKIKRSAKVTDDIVSYQWFVQDLKANLSLYRNKTIEIECHPGLSFNIDETELLMADQIRNVISDYTFINYNEL